jgi:cytohesin
LFLVAASLTLHALADDAMDLRMAAMAGNVKEVKRLLDKGVDVNAGGDDGWTALHWAAQTGHTDVAKLLLARGANPSARHSDGFVPLHMAANKDIAIALIEKGADINARVDDNRSTPLHLAALNGRLDVVQLLIEKGAEINPKTKKGQTPLDLARKKAIKELLQKKGGKKAKDLR